MSSATTKKWGICACTDIPAFASWYGAKHTTDKEQNGDALLEFLYTGFFYASLLIRADSCCLYQKEGRKIGS